MTSVGSNVPATPLAYMGKEGPEEVSLDKLSAGKRIAVFAVPGAFTPTCSAQHLPGYLKHADALREKGIDTIACVSVNDAFVMRAWGEKASVGDNILLLADGNGAFTKAMGMELDASAFGMGNRSKRYSMLVEDGVIKILNEEENASKAEASGAESLLKQL